MAYTKQNFEDGQVLTAEHLNNMERGIENAVSITEQNLTEEQKNKLNREEDLLNEFYEKAKDFAEVLCSKNALLNSARLS